MLLNFAVKSSEFADVSRQSSFLLFRTADKRNKRNAPEEKFANVNKGKGPLELERIGYHVRECSDPV